MTTQLRIADVQQFASVQEDVDWGADGVLNAGDKIYNERTRSWVVVTDADVTSDYALDAYLERATGAKIDLINDSRYPYGLKYISYRNSSDTRIVKAGYAQTLSLPSLSQYKTPSSSTNASRKAYRLSYECWSDPYSACATSLNSEYSSLTASASTYTSAYTSYKSALGSFSTKYTVSLSDIEGSSGLITKGKKFTDAKAAYETQLASFNRVTYPWERPVPPRNPDNDDWETPVPAPRNPDNDDWETPPSAPQNPDNDDWGDGSQQDKDW